MNHNTWPMSLKWQQGTEWLDTTNEAPNSFQVPLTKNTQTQGDRGFSITTANYWNKLPYYIKEAET